MPIHIEYTNTTDLVGNLVLSGINGYIVSVFPSSSDVVIDKMFVTSGGVRYVHATKYSNVAALPNTSVKVNVLYIPY